MVVLCVGCLSQQAQLYMLKWFTVLEGLGLKYEESLNAHSQPHCLVKDL